MSRPAYSVQDQTAKERICNSFWLILSDPKKKLSVIEICRLAGVNKNTFYYHFETIDSLSEYIFDDFLDRELASSMLGAAISGESLKTGEAVPSRSDGFQKICLLASSRQPVLIDLLKTALRNIWCDVMGVDYSALPEEKKDIIGFMLGGILSMLEQCAERKNISFEAFTEINSRPFFKKTLANLYEEMNSAESLGHNPQ